MKKFIKSIAAMLVLATLLCCFGCKNNLGNGEAVSAEATSESVVDENGNLEIVRDGKSDYVIVWRGRALEAEKQAAFDLGDWIAESTGVQLEKKTDLTIETADEFSKTRKIVVGRLDRYIEKKWSDFGENDYCIEVTGRDIYIYGGSDTAVYAAALKFKEGFLNEKKSSVSVSPNFVLKQEVDGREDYISDPFAMIPVWISEFQASEKMLDFSEKKEALADTDGRLMSIVHRGDVEHYPENSVEGIISAIQMGADMIEIDVRMTKDNVPVLMHDYTISRTTNYSFVKGSTVNGITLPTTDDVSEWTYEQLKCLKLYEGKGGGKLTDYIIPTLEEVLTVAKGNCFIICDKIDTYNDFKKLVLPVMIKTGAYDTVIMSHKVTPSGASAIQETIAAIPENTLKLIPFFMDDINGSAPNKWESAITTNKNGGFVSFFYIVGGLEPSSTTDVLEKIAHNESALKSVKGKARLTIACYEGKNVYETPKVWDRCVEVGLNVAFVEKPIQIQEYILQKYFN